MRLTRLVCLPIALVAVCLSLVVSCAAQMENATISGRITDQSGALLTGVTVQLLSAQRGTTQETITNEAGIYVFSSVQPGVYHLTVTKQGFERVVYPNLTANVQDHIEQNFALQVGAASETVTVSGAANNINTQDASVSTVVDSQFVENMPLNGRSFQSLIALTPGRVIRPGQQHVLGRVQRQRAAHIRELLHGGRRQRQFRQRRWGQYGRLWAAPIRFDQRGRHQRPGLGGRHAGVPHPDLELCA